MCIRDSLNIPPKKMKKLKISLDKQKKVD